MSRAREKGAGNATTLSVRRRASTTCRCGFPCEPRLDYEEADVWGRRTSPNSWPRTAALTPLLEADGLPRGSLWESRAIMQYLCNKHGLDRFYPPIRASAR